MSMMMVYGAPSHCDQGAIILFSTWAIYLHGEGEHMAPHLMRRCENRTQRVPLCILVDKVGWVGERSINLNSNIRSGNFPSVALKCCLLEVEVETRFNAASELQVSQTQLDSS